MAGCLLSDFFLAGHMDRSMRSSFVRAPARPPRPTSSAIAVRQSQPTPPPIVRANRGLLLMHLWNVVDNAFRHARPGSASILSFAVEVDRDTICLLAENVGEPIEHDKAQLISELLMYDVDSPEFRRTEMAMEKWNSSAWLTAQLERENRGIGLRRFNEYLFQLWRAYDKPKASRGRVTRLNGGTKFEFYFPLHH